MTSNSNTPAALKGRIYGPGGDGIGPTGLANSYQMPVQSGYTGTGHSLGYVIDSDPSQSDLATFLNDFMVQRTGTYTRVNVNGGGSGFNSSTSSDSVEATLDYQTEASLAPGANVVEFSIPNLSFQNIYDAMEEVLAQYDTIDAVSISIEGCEASEGDQLLTLMNDAMHQADMEGITFSSSTGDNGLFKCGSPATSGLASPASLPDIVAIGGTFAGAMGTNSPYTKQGGWSYTGGGYSQIWKTPTYQQYLSFIPSRAIPDVSLAADNGYNTAGDYAYLIFNGQFLGEGGTSWASPIFAAFQATLNQENANRRGFAGVAMYVDNQDYNYTNDCLTDVTIGNNGSAAEPGWDYVTGLGSIYTGCNL